MRKHALISIAVLVILSVGWMVYLPTYRHNFLAVDCKMETTTNSGTRAGKVVVISTITISRDFMGRCINTMTQITQDPATERVVKIEKTIAVARPKEGFIVVSKVMKSY